jgi:hypothetical protein
MRYLTLLRLSSAAFLIAGLASCGPDQSQTGTTTALKAVGSAMSTSLHGGGKGASASTGLTRAQLAEIITPVDLVTIERRGAQGVIAKIATNQGVETWSSIDKKTIALRGGVVVATRGLGEDLMSASAPQIGQLLNAPSSYSRIHTILNGEDKPVHLRFNCQAIRKGGETITVVERAFATQRVTETCSGPDGAFANDYWFQTGGKLRKSRQWISESVGYVAIEHLR